MSRMIKQTFNSSGSWTCPAGVTQIIVLGMGGGSGGGAAIDPAISNTGGMGGMGNSLKPIVLTVVPNTTYTITIGAGGTGGVVIPASFPGPGGTGGDSSFGALCTWQGAGMGQDLGSSFNNTPINCGVYQTSFEYPATGLFGVFDTNLPYSAPDGGAAGTAFPGYPGKTGQQVQGGATDLTYGTGGGAGMAGEGPGGVGGAGALVLNGSGTVGGSAAANSGAGGGGGGGANGSGTAANGGDGGSGQIIVMWAE